MGPTAGAGGACTLATGGACLVLAGGVLTAEGAMVVGGVAVAGYGAATLVQINGNPVGSGKRFSPEQSTIIARVKAAKKRGGISMEEDQQLLDEAKRAGLYFRRPELHPDRNFTALHIHIGPIDHIKVIP